MMETRGAVADAFKGGDAGTAHIFLRPAKFDYERICARGPFTDCDEYAASDVDPQRKVTGVPFDKVNFDLAVPACEAAARQYPNSARLLFQLGRAYQKGNRFEAALQQYGKAAERGSALAQNNIGVLYENGLGLPQDYEQAATWYRKAAEQGLAAAQFVLGAMYENGRGVPKDVPQAVFWYRKVTDQGNSTAQDSFKRLTQGATQQEQPALLQAGDEPARLPDHPNVATALSERAQQVEGTYDGTFTLDHIPGEHQISLTFQQSGQEVTVTYQSVTGGRGSGKGTITGSVITAVPLRSEPSCPGLFTASFTFSADTVSFSYSGQDCFGPAQGRGIAKKPNFASPLTSKADELTNKAFALYQAGKSAEAIPLGQQALAIREKVLGPDHPDVAMVLDGLGFLYEKEGRNDEAEPLYKRALAIREKTLSPDHREHFLVAQSLNRLAALYDHQCRYAEAEPLLKRSLAIHEEAFGLYYAGVANVLNNLAVLYDHQGRSSEAEPLYKRALAIYENLGADLPNVNLANLLNNLAALYDHQRRYAEAEPLYKRALPIFKKRLVSIIPSSQLR